MEKCKSPSLPIEQALPLDDSAYMPSSGKKRRVIPSDIEPMPADTSIIPMDANRELSASSIDFENESLASSFGSEQDEDCEANKLPPLLRNHKPWDYS